MLTHRVAYNPHIHISKNFIAQVDALLSKEPTVPYSKTLIEDAELEISVSPPSTELKEGVLRKIGALVPAFDRSRQRLLLVNPGGNEFLPQRRWAAERFAALIKRVIEAYPDMLVLITGAKNEAEHANALSSSVSHPRCIVFAGHSTFAELPA